MVMRQTIFTSSYLLSELLSSPQQKSALAAKPTIILFHLSPQVIAKSNKAAT